jgi:SAM-dependent methyltransferase
MLWAKRAYEFVIPFFDDRSGHFLDVACGLGTTVAYFQNNGWVADGVDADPSTAEHHLRLGIKSTVGQIENIKIDTRFDLISIAHALYFISDPLTFVARVKALIKKEGFFLIILSDFLSTLSSGQPGFAHTWYPSSRSMIYVLCQEGFQFVAQQKIRGSMLVLLRNSDSPTVKAPENYPYLSYLKHFTQRFRYNVIGRPILFTASMVRKLRKVSNQSNKAP